MRGRVLLILAVLALLVAGVVAFVLTRGERPFTTASKLFTESILLAEAAEQAAELRGVPADHEEQLGGSAILLAAVKSGDIDAYPEYTGTLFQELLRDRGLTTIDELRAALEADGVGMTGPIGFNNSYAIGMTKERAAELGVTKISDLADHPDLRVSVSHEYLVRGDGWPALATHYGLPQSPDGIDHDLAYRALDAGETDVIDLYGTDAEIAYYDLAVLEDDRSFYPRYDAVFLYRLDLVDRHPEAVAALESFEGRVDAATMIAANEAAKIDKRPPAQVAGELLRTALGVDASGTDAAAVEGWTGRLVRYTIEHLILVVSAMAAATVIAVPLGILSVKSRQVGRFVLPAVGVMQTVPSLALLAFMIPVLPLIGLPGLGRGPAIIALALYALLPMVRNTQQGLLSIPRGVQESADALGLPGWSKLTRVELPLALPSILAGVKTSAVITVGFATLGAFIGAGGYGEPILVGLRLDSTARLLEGAVPAAAMALAAQFGLDALGRLLIPRGLRA